ncbi:phosphotransferase [Cellulomonas sp. DKR-3]|uniref:Phosphotransferase n=1 Tax=Cellulomonas fulva TaxID=2835530 RepID=A0ABS5TXN6_9CELL|nr:phosphotransferase [Cellulomonas fulva]MBT0993861.1 phosphotransferase [Cellulomonas fulva]
MTAPDEQQPDEVRSDEVTAADVTLARAVIEPLGCAVGSVAVLGGGAMNRVLRVRGVQTDGTRFDWVVRSPLGDRWPAQFAEESWAATAAARAGVPAPRVVHVGLVGDRAVMVHEHAPDDGGPVARPWSALGEYARRLADVALDDAPDGLFTRFGRDVPRAWAQHVAHNRQALTDDDPLLRDGAYAAHQQAGLRALVDELATTRLTYGLTHGDLAPRHLVAPAAGGPPVLLDWGNASTGPSPWTDLRHVLVLARVRREVAEADLAEAAAAAGAPLDRATERVLVQLAVLQLLDVPRWALDRRPDLYQHFLDECRTGLAVLLP